MVAKREISKNPPEDARSEESQNDSHSDRCVPNPQAPGTVRVPNQPRQIQPTYLNWHGQSSRHQHVNSSSFAFPPYRQYAGQQWNSFSSPLSGLQSAPGYLGQTGHPPSQVVFGRVLVDRPEQSRSSDLVNLENTPSQQENIKHHEHKRRRISPARPLKALSADTQAHPEVIKEKYFLSSSLR